MTGQLRTTLNTRADDLTTWEADLDAIVRDGDRRVRRRRVAVASGLAGVLAVAGGTAALTTRGHARPQPAEQDTRPLSYAVGQVIHTGNGQVDVGVKVESMVQTINGFVFSGPDQKVYEEKDGDVQEIGHLANAQSRIVTGDDGLVVTWWDGERIHAWPTAFASGTANTIPVAESWQPDSPPHVEALSDGHMWYWDGQETKVAEVRPTPSTAFWPDSGFPTPDTIQDAAGDKLLVRVAGGMAVIDANLRPLDGDQLPGWEPGTDLSGVEPQVPNLSTGDLAPDGKHWFSHDNDEFALFDSASGQRQEPAHPGFAFAAPYQWLGDDTMAVLATHGSSDDPQISLLTCRVSTNDCQVTAPDIGGYGDVAIPVGQRIGD